MGHKDRIRAHYEPRIAPQRAGYDIVNWADAASQVIRFEVLAENVDLRGKTLLDVGCGTGDLWAFLKARGIAADYTGVDLLRKMVDAARERHPDGRFVCADIFAEQPFSERRFDVAFSSGAFNLNIGNNRDFLPRAVGRLLELARECLVFNLLHNRAENQYDHCVYFNPADVLALLKPFSCETEILDNYLPNDFTVICRKAPGKGQ